MRGPGGSRSKSKQRDWVVDWGFLAIAALLALRGWVAAVADEEGSRWLQRKLLKEK